MAVDEPMPASIKLNITVVAPVVRDTMLPIPGGYHLPLYLYL
jgi:hypothetical protein